MTIGFIETAARRRRARKRAALVLIGCTALSAPAFAAGVDIIEGTYGCPCEPPANCNATPAVAKACSGKASCAFAVDNNLCASPFPGGSRLFVVYRCGADQKSATFRQGEQAEIACP